jgi:hypothetical protein
VHGTEGERVGVDDVTIGDTPCRVIQFVTGGHHVLRARRSGQGESARHVVVVHVGFEDVGDALAASVDDVEHPIDVALGVHHHRDTAAADEVTAVSEPGGLDHRHLDAAT